MVVERRETVTSEPRHEESGEIGQMNAEEHPDRRQTSEKAVGWKHATYVHGKERNPGWSRVNEEESDRGQRKTRPGRPFSGTCLSLSGM